MMMRCRREALADWSLGLFIHEVGVASEAHVRYAGGLVLRRSAIDFLFSREEPSLRPFSNILPATKELCISPDFFAQPRVR